MVLQDSQEMGQDKACKSDDQDLFVATPSAKQQDRLLLDPTCFLRCIACLGVVIFHVAYYAGRAADDKQAIDGALAHHLWLILVINPEPAMQTFMCLTGFLATVSLVPALEATHSYTQTVLRYYRKRVLRIVPAYYTMLLVARLLVAALGESDSVPPDVRRSYFEPLGVLHTPLCKTSIMHNVVFAHNHLPSGGCYVTTWSLAVQMQFWCIYPLFLLLLQPHKPGFRKRITSSLLATIGAVLAYRAWQMFEKQLWTRMPLQLFHPADTETLDLLIFLGRHAYFGSVTRLGPLCFGGLAALIAMDSAPSQTIPRQNRRLQALWICLILSNFFGCFVNKVGPHVDSTHVLANPFNLAFAYVGITGVLSPMLPALTLVLITSKQRGSSMVARAFSLPAFKWLANITYDIFLIHPLVLLGVLYLLPPSSWFAPDRPVNFAAVSCLVFLLSVLAAWLHNKFWRSVMSRFRAGPSNVQ